MFAFLAVCDRSSHDGQLLLVKGEMVARPCMQEGIENKLHPVSIAISRNEADKYMVWAFAHYQKALTVSLQPLIL